MNAGDGQKIQKYNERYRFWSDKRISQLSFHNNLLLTLGFAGMGYFWKERHSVYTRLTIDFNSSIDWTILFFVLGIFMLFLSVLSGFLLSLSRLYDLRLTANIILTRKRVAAKKKTLKDEPRSQRRFLSNLRSLSSVVCHYRQYEITKETIETDAAGLQDRFTSARQKSKDLGELTWGLLLWQTISMLVSILVLTVVRLLK